MEGLNVNLALAVLDAHLAGLTREEIIVAVAMGEAHGFACDPQHGAVPKVDNPHYWEQIEAEAHTYWHERLRMSDDDL